MPLAPTDETTTIIVIGATIVHGRNAVGDRGTVIVEDLYVAEEHCAEEDVYVVEDQYMAVELYVAEELCVVEQMYMAVELVCARRDGVVPDNSGLKTNYFSTNGLPGPKVQRSVDMQTCSSLSLVTKTPTPLNTLVTMVRTQKPWISSSCYGVNHGSTRIHPFTDGEAP